MLNPAAMEAGPSPDIERLLQKLKLIDIDGHWDRRHGHPCVMVQFPRIRLAIYSNCPQITAHLERQYSAKAGLNGLPDMELLVTREGSSSDTLIISPERAHLACMTEEDLLHYASKDRQTGQVESRYLIHDHGGLGPRLGDSSADLPVNLADLLEMEMLKSLSQKAGWWLLHGGSLAHSGKGIMICGKSGTGKTTLTMALHASGYDLLNDDTTCLDVPDGILHRFPGKPRVRCSSLEHLREIATENQIQGLIDKSKLEMGGSQSVRLSHVFILNGFGEGPSAERLSIGESAQCLMKQIMERPSSPLTESLFKAYTLADRIKCYRLTVGRVAATVQLLGTLMACDGEAGKD